MLNISDPMKLMKSLPIGLVLCRMDGSLVFVNPAFSRIVGYSEDALMAMNCHQLTAEHDDLIEHGRLQQLQEQGHCDPYIKELFNASGQRVSVRISSELVEVDGETHIWSSVEDISDIRQLQDGLRKSQQKFRSLFDLASDCIVLLDTQGRIVDINQEGHQRLGYSKEEMLGHSIAEFDAPHFAPLVNDKIEHLLHYGHACFESAHCCKNGQEMAIEVNCRVIELDGQSYFLSVIRDISEQKSMRERVREREAMYRAVFETSRDGFWIVDMQGHFLEVNDAYVHLSGYSREELLTMRIPDIEANESMEETIAHVQKLIRDGHDRFETVHRRKDGSLWPVEVITSYWDINGGRLFVFCVDITARKKTEKRLRKLSQAVESSAEGILVTDQNSVIEFINPAFTRITGYTREEVIGKKPSILKSSAQDPSFYKEMWETITSGQSWQGTLIDRRKDGSFYPALMSVSPIMDDHGTITHYVAIQQDMSGYKKLEQQFHQAQKMESLGTLVGGIAHDFNNMLAGIMGNSYMLRMQAADSPALISNIDTIDKICERASGMIKKMLTYAKAEHIEPKTFLLNDMIRESLELSEAAIPESIERIVSIAREDMFVHGDPIQLQQVIINILNNARDAIGDKPEGRITCLLDVIEVDSRFKTAHLECKEDRYAHLIISDNGCGIPEAVLGRIFDPFFTTKGVEKGNGLGLAMVYGCINNHHGAIEVESEVSQGATFNIYLPMVSTMMPSVAPEESKVYGNGHELIIIADDDKYMRHMYEQVLSSFGYRVLTTDDGRGAIRLFEENKHDCSLVILDVVMPRMGGVEAARIVRNRGAEVPLLFITGYDKDIALKKAEGMGKHHVISKPFNIPHLRASIRNLIEE